MKKVCHVTIGHNRDDVRVFQRECCSLMKEGYEVTLIVNDQKKDQVVNGVNIYSVHSPLGSKIKRIKAIYALYKKALEIDAELYHLHEPDLLFFSLFLKRKGKKVIFDSHEIYSLQIRFRGIHSKNFQKILRKLYCLFERNICKKVDGVILPTSIRHKGNNNWTPFEGINNVVYIANYPQKINFVKDRSEGKEFKVCYTGCLSKERGISNLIKACFLAEVPLILAGSFLSKAYEQELREDVSFSCVDYRGVCDREAVYQIYQEASLGASVLLNFGQYNVLNTLATKVYEYFQCGLPSLIGSYPYVEELNAIYHFGHVVNSNDIEEIKNAILYLKEHPDLCDQMGKNGYNLYKTKFMWEQEEIKLIELYRQVLNG